MKVILQHILIISLQLIIWLLTVLPINSSECNILTNQTVKKHSSSSTLRPTVERVFSRKKRFLLLPPGGSLKFTANVGERLLAQYPRGLNFIFEAATYYEGFSTPIELIPKFLRKPTTPTPPKPVGSTKPLYIYIPGTEIRYKGKPANMPAKVQRIDAEDTALQWVDSQPANKFAQKYADPKHWTKYSKYNNTAYQQKYAWTPAFKQQKYHYRPKPNAKWTRWTTTSKPAQWWQPREVNGSHYQTGGIYKTIAHHTPSLHQYHGHRDRRQLFASVEAFSNILGFDVKVCLLRAICDSQRLLLPPGHSMLQDMLRVILTVPRHNDISDEYTHAMNGNAVTCEQRYRQKCPINLIDWLLNPVKKFKS